MKPLGSVTVTRVRRCAEEAKGGLELAWSFGVASAFQRLCAASTSSSRFGAEVTGHTTPAVADVGRGSLRVRFMRPHDGDDALGLRRFPTGGLLLGVRRSRSVSGSSSEDVLFAREKSEREGSPRRWVEPSHRFVPAIAAAPGKRGEDRHGESRDGLAELVVMARPLVIDARDSETDGDVGFRDVRASAKPTAAPRFVTSLDDAALRLWLPVGAPVELAVVRRVTGFHLGLNANRWLKIRMREIADGVAGVASVADARKSAPGARASTAAFYRDTGLVLDPSGAVHDAPAGAAFEFEHWGAGGNTGVSGQVTRESA